MKLSRFPKLAILSYFIFHAGFALARGGGGGSGGGGGGGGGGFGGGSGSGGGSPWISLIYLIVFAIILIGGAIKKRQQNKLEHQEQAQIVAQEGINLGVFQAEFEKLFKDFETAWANFDLDSIKKLTTDSYFKRMVLELNVLKNEGRSNPMHNVQIFDTVIIGEEPSVENKTELIVKVTASAEDTLMDTANNKPLFFDSRQFTEYWHIKKVDGNWRLDLIKQETEEAWLVEDDIKMFAAKNEFFFDADFGWLMMPNRGALFRKTNFGQSDINNHVIGYFRNKIVEFYTYIPNTQNQDKNNYLIAQAILPIQYKDILIKKKRFFNFTPWGLKRMYLESADFNNKFALFADPQDQVNSLELLTPNFMEKIYQLPFELNIEIVGNTLYFYTKDRGAANYQQMLEIISWAFDEMKM